MVREDSAQLAQLGGRKRQPRRRYYVESLGHGLAILDCFVDEPREFALVELSQRVGFSPPTTMRLIRTLEEAGYVRQHPKTKRYRLSLKLLKLRNATLSLLDYADVVVPHLESLAATVKEWVGMGVLDGTVMRFAIKVGSPRLVSANVPAVGEEFPPHASAMGKVLLAFLSPGRVREIIAGRPFERFTSKTITSMDTLQQHLTLVREAGYAVSEHEWERGLRSIAVPVFGHDGEAVAAICVKAVRPGATVALLVRNCLPPLLRTAEAISEELGYEQRSGPSRRSSARSR